MKIIERPKKAHKTSRKVAHYWLIEQNPKRSKRLPQLNKSNHIGKARQGKNEFIQMAEKAEGED